MFFTELLCRSYSSWILSTIICLGLRVFGSSTVCNESTVGCCDGYRWIVETKQCEKCTLGYTGDNCTEQCPYPTYGEKCQGYCNCSKDTCDLSWGCGTLTTLTTEANMSASRRIAQKYVTYYKTYITGQSFTTTQSKSMDPRSTELLLLFIKVLGSVDIVLLCAYLTLCIHDRNGPEKTMDTASHHANFPGGSTAYENIEASSFSPSIVN